MKENTLYDAISNEYKVIHELEYLDTSELDDEELYDDYLDYDEYDDLDEEEDDEDDEY